MSNFHLFWGGPFSQWYPCVFEIEGVRYNCTEQYMMVKKAQLFGDADAAAAIMATTVPSEQKAIGRQVKGFDDKTWHAVARDIVYRGNMAKFTQNPELRKFILCTFEQEIVEASPEDVIWGIGLGEHHPDAQDKSKWKGTNWLGQVLMDVRDALWEVKQS